MFPVAPETRSSQTGSAAGPEGSATEAARIDEERGDINLTPFPPPLRGEEIAPYPQETSVGFHLRLSPEAA